MFKKILGSRSTSAIAGGDIEYRCGKFSILLPGEHVLPAYQKHHRLYDRFLPHLVSHLGRGSTVVDVGANCGDTLAAMYSANPALAYICIEPDDTFFQYLQRNICRIKKLEKGASIDAVKALVGKDVSEASLVATSASTRKADVNGTHAAIRTKTLDHILEGAGNISLIKSDVDGFDYDIIGSAEVTLSDHSPLLFFECYFEYPFQKSGYESMLSRLQSTGYELFVLFDNFGTLMLGTERLREINQLLDYVWAQNLHRATRTIYYYDVLAAPGKQYGLVEQVITSYRNIQV